MRTLRTKPIHAFVVFAVTLGAGPPLLPAQQTVEPDQPVVAETAMEPGEPAVVETPVEPDQPAPAATTSGPTDDIRFNFKGAPLTDVLNYLSEAAGFVIITDSTPAGTVNVVSHQPLTADEAFDLLNTILVDHGYVAIRNGRILKIVERDEAHTHYLPVRTGSDPESIPPKDEMVTQILPVRYVEVEPLIENILPLLDEGAQITPNEDSNAIVMTDTLVNIRRVAEIIQALDTSMADVSTIRVFPLEYADAEEMAELVNEIFEPTGTGSSSRGGRSGGDDFRAMMMSRFGGGRSGGGGRGGR